MSRIYAKDETVLDAQKLTGAGTSILVSSCQTLVLWVGTAGMGAGDTVTIKVQGSLQDSAPTFGSAQSVSNAWDYVQMVDLEDGSNVDGDTGITFSDSNDVRQFEINTNGLRHLTCNITANSDTSNVAVTAKVSMYNNE